MLDLAWHKASQEKDKQKAGGKVKRGMVVVGGYPAEAAGRAVGIEQVPVELRRHNVAAEVLPRSLGPALSLRRCLWLGGSLRPSPSLTRSL